MRAAAALVVAVVAGTSLVNHHESHSARASDAKVDALVADVQKA